MQSDHNMRTSAQHGYGFTAFDSKVSITKNFEKNNKGGDQRGMIKTERVK